MSDDLLTVKPCFDGWWDVVACGVSKMPWFFWYYFP